MTPIVMKELALMTIIGQIALLFLILFRAKIKKRVSQYSYQIMFFSSLVATLGSLFFSEIAKFTPCVLCWYQRIFMYPQPLLLYLAIIREERVVSPYLLLLNVLGAMVAGYHYLIQRIPSASLLNCQINGNVSCTKNVIFYFGYVSIPMMALTVFVFNIILLSFFQKKQ